MRTCPREKHENEEEIRRNPFVRPFLDNEVCPKRSDSDAGVVPNRDGICSAELLVHPVLILMLIVMSVWPTETK